MNGNENVDVLYDKERDVDPGFDLGNLILKSDQNLAT